MIPPEPEPGPEPEPETGVYTYSSSTTVPIGSTVGVVYNNIQDANGSCYLTVTVGSSDVALNRLIINYVPAFDMTNYYFCNAGLSICVLASNASVGGTHPYYSYDSDNDSMVLQGDCYVKSSSPVDYFEVIDSGVFELELRQSKGDVRESDLDYY